MMKKRIGVPVMLVTLVVLGCLGNMSQVRGSKPSLESFLDKFSDTAFIYDGTSEDSTNLVAQVNIKDFKTSLKDASPFAVRPVWKGSFDMVSRNNSVLRISLYGRFFSTNGGSRAYLIDNKYAERFDAFLDTLMTERIIPWRKTQNTANTDLRSW